MSPHQSLMPCKYLYNNVHHSSFYNNSKVPTLRLNSLKTESDSVKPKPLETDSVKNEIENLKKYSTFKLKKTLNIILALAVDDITELSTIYKSLLASDTLDVKDLTFIGGNLFKNGVMSKNCKMVRDAFLIASFANLINPCDMENLMVTIGKEYIENFFVNQTTTPHSLLFAEFVNIRLFSCNTGSVNYGKRFCRLLLRNVKENRDPILGQNTTDFTEDLKSVLDKKYKSKYFEEELERFKESQDLKYIYNAIHAIYCDISKDTFFSRAHHLAKIVQIIEKYKVKIDSTEYFIVLCNCLHNFHVILDRKFLFEDFHLVVGGDSYNYVHINNNKESEPTTFNIDDYMLVVKQFLMIYCTSVPIFPSTAYCFKTNFCSLFIEVVYSHYKELLKEKLLSNNDNEEMLNRKIKARIEEGIKELEEFKVKAGKNDPHYQHLQKSYKDTELEAYYWLTYGKELESVLDPYADAIS
ncbi:hypothetical protein ABK040_006898 [Willaertia magna]